MEETIINRIAELENDIVIHKRLLASCAANHNFFMVRRLKGIIERKKAIIFELKDLLP